MHVYHLVDKPPAQATSRELSVPEATVAPRGGIWQEMTYCPRDVIKI